MKTKIKFLVVVLMSIFISSCGTNEGRDDYPKNGESNNGQITGYLISRSLDYDEYLGYKIALDENNNGIFEKNEHYAWMPNDMYNKIIGNDSILIKAVHFQEDHFMKPCDAYIVFDAAYK